MRQFKVGAIGGNSKIVQKEKIAKNDTYCEAPFGGS